MFVTEQISLIALLAFATVHAQVELSSVGCGQTKGCWFEPQDCAEFDNVSSCSYALTWQPDAGGVWLELGASITDLGSPFMGKYMSVAFSYDDKMGDDAVVECVSTASGEVRAFMSYNDGTHNFRLLSASSKMLNSTGKVVGRVVNGFLSCRVWRANAAVANINPAEKRQVFNLTANPWILQMAKGLAVNENYATLIHWLMDGDLFPFVAKQSVSLLASPPQVITRSKHYDIPRTVQYKLAQAHAVLLLIGWWFFASIALLISRYFKPMWPQTKLLGTTVWYQLHRDLMIAALVFICVGFGLVYIQAGDWKSCTFVCDSSDYALAAHTILGVICTAIAIAQPFFAWVRPYMKRIVFNWLHWFMGMGSWVLATIVIFLGCPLGKTHLRRMYQYDADFIMAAYIVTFLLACIVLEFLIKHGEETNKVAAIKGEIPLNVMAGPGTESVKGTQKQAPKTAKARLAVLITFTICAAAFIIALGYLICTEH